MTESEEAVAVVDVATLHSWLGLFAEEVATNRDLLTRLDSAIGDADHGANLDRGMSAVVVALEKEPAATPAALFKTTGMTLVSTVGGASGPLYGTFFLRMAGSVGEARSLDAAGFAARFEPAVDGVVARGRAQSGDKTMYDALAPACDALDDAVADGAPLSAGLAAAREAADAGRDATIPMLARKGRASYLGSAASATRIPAPRRPPCWSRPPPGRWAEDRHDRDRGRVAQPRSGERGGGARQRDGARGPGAHPGRGRA
jgi:dihydroxyacetone kinase-like protein